MRSPTVWKRKWPDSMMPAWIGPTATWCTPSPVTGGGHAARASGSGGGGAGPPGLAGLADDALQKGMEQAEEPERERDDRDRGDRGLAGVHAAEQDQQLGDEQRRRWQPGQRDEAHAHRRRCRWALRRDTRGWAPSGVGAGAQQWQGG